jgi:hypothetical protein
VPPPHLDVGAEANGIYYSPTQGYEWVNPNDQKDFGVRPIENFSNDSQTLTESHRYDSECGQTLSDALAKESDYAWICKKVEATHDNIKVEGFRRGNEYKVGEAISLAILVFNKKAHKLDLIIYDGSTKEEKYSKKEQVLTDDRILSLTPISINEPGKYIVNWYIDGSVEFTDFIAISK